MSSVEGGRVEGPSTKEKGLLDMDKCAVIAGAGRGL